MTYVEIDADGWRFQPRVAAVFTSDDHVLLQAALDGDFWVLPGGRIQPLELTAQALVRTMRWEIGQGVTVQRLLWVTEHVTRISGQPFHELGFYYAVDLPEGSPFMDLTRDHAGLERGRELLLRWFRFSDLANLRVFPEFLRTGMEDLPESPRHIVHGELAGRAP